MLNNLTNFFNLFTSNRFKRELEDTDVIAVGTQTGPRVGSYKPTAIQFKDLKEQLTILNPGQADFTYQLGEYVPSEGGVIFHRYKESGQEKYLIVDITDLSASSAYSNINNILIGPSAQSTWDGSSNNTAIVNQVGATSGAAILCDASTNGGQNDWYLPAIDELSLIWHNRFNINKTLSNVGGAGIIGFDNYWSSTEYSATLAFTFSFLIGNANLNLKTNTFSVRAVRALTI
jgi:hypothetical protein